MDPPPKERRMTNPNGDDPKAPTAVTMIPPSDASSTTTTRPSEERTENDDDDQSRSTPHSLVPITLPVLFGATVPLFVLAALCYGVLGLPTMGHGVLEGGVRTAVQLSTLAALLRPIFAYGPRHPVLVVSYCTWLLTLAAYEASARTKYEFDGQFVVVLASLTVNVGGVALGTFGWLLRRGLDPCPWNPRYVIPVVGMLLGNSIGAVSLSLDALTTAWAERTSELDLYLSLGATPHEAAARFFRDALTAGATPVLNTMRVTGLISIPGMMTGQILGGGGGGSTQQAARYQMLIIYLIATSVLGTVLCNTWLVTTWVGFDHGTAALRTDRLVVSRRRSVWATLTWMASGPWTTTTTPHPSVADPPIHGISTTATVRRDLTTANNNNATIVPEPNAFEIRALHQTCSFHEGHGTCANDNEQVARDDALLRIQGLTKSIGATNDKYDSTSTRVLFRDIDLNVSRGDLLLVRGPSGAGKSTFLRAIAGLISVDHGTLSLEDNMILLGDDHHHHHHQHDPVAWRKHVRYVPQSKVDIPGTPLDLVDKVTQFSTWIDHRVDKANFVRDTVSYLSSWDMDGTASLEMEWSQLSGGESQRVMMALTLASRPRIILFDESTSALDKTAKIAVEESIKAFVRHRRGAVLWISHDEEQAGRMSVMAPEG